MSTLLGSLVSGCSGATQGLPALNLQGQIVGTVPTSQTVTVPNVIGQTLVYADNRLGQFALMCRSAPSISTEPMGTVLSQEPSAGARVPRYSIVMVRYAVIPNNPPQVDNGCAVSFLQVPTPGN
ncbi:MAG: PASTA domain-containing protein [Acidimicrobiales bacterium]